MDSRHRTQGAVDARRWGVPAGLLVAAAVTWLAAASLVWGLTPRLAADPAFADSAGALAGLLRPFGLTGALAGVAMLLGLALVRRAPTRSTGRAILLAAGLVAAAAGLLLLNLGTFQAPAGFHWSVGAALAGGAIAASFALAGLLACAASLTRLLPGPPLGERMRLPGLARPAARLRPRMLPRTAALVIAWLCLVLVALASRGQDAMPALGVGVAAFLGVQFAMPTLAGAVVAGWREGARDRLRTLGLAAAAGATSSWLFLLTLVAVRYYRFNPVGYVVWWGLMGGLFGAAGYGAWYLLARRRTPQTAP